MSKKKRKKQKQKLKKRELVVVNVSGGKSSRDAGDMLAGLVGQALVAGALYGLAQAIAAEPKRRSLVRFAMRHPVASLELAGMAAEDTRQKMVSRFHSWVSGLGADAEGARQKRLTYRPPEVER